MFLGITVHDEESPIKDTTVQIKTGLTHPAIPNFSGADFVVTNWWDRVQPYGSWKKRLANPINTEYSSRAVGNLPDDDEVLCGVIDGFSHLVHISELDLPE